MFLFQTKFKTKSKTKLMKCKEKDSKSNKLSLFHLLWNKKLKIKKNKNYKKLLDKVSFPSLNKGLKLRSRKK